MDESPVGGGGIRWPRRRGTNGFPQTVDRALCTCSTVGWIDAHPKPRWAAKNLEHVAPLRPVLLSRHLNLGVGQAQELGRCLTNSDLVDGVPTSIFTSAHRDFLEAILHG